MRISTQAASQAALSDLMRAQREAYDARQQLIRANLVRSLNSIAVYRALGAWPRDEAGDSDEILTPES